jgi:hypothetical protein
MASRGKVVKPVFEESPDAVDGHLGRRGAAHVSAHAVAHHEYVPVGGVEIPQVVFVGLPHPAHVGMVAKFKVKRIAVLRHE